MTKRFWYRRALNPAWVMAVVLTQACGRDPRDPEAEIIAEDQLSELQESEIAQLEALGYAAGDRPSSEETLVVLHDPKKAQQGYNLYSSEHASRAFLVDMDGELLHMWELPRSETDKKVPKFGRIRLLDNGELLVQVTHRGMYRLDRHSNVLWSYQDRVHHDFDLSDDGTLYVLTQKNGVYPAYGEERPIRNEAIVVVSPEGRVVKKVWMLDAFQRSSCCADFLNYAEAGDIFHTNTLHILDGRLEHRHPAFRAGNILTSFRNFNAIAVVDMAAGQIAWGYHGPFVDQHDPTVLDNGNLLVFDNRAPHHGSAQRSRVLELDPFRDEIVWKFPASSATSEFELNSTTASTSQRLANGNTLITETRGGRILEVTHDLEVVWMFVNPARVPEKEHNIAQIYKMQRLPADLALDWIPPHTYPDDALSAFPAPVPASGTH